jgi:hypothetical protein
MDLLRDDELMAGGSDANGCFYSTNSQTVSPSEPIKFQNTQDALNIERGANGQSLYVRRDGLYMCVFHITPDVECQFSPFVNGVPEFDKSMGTSNAAGQLTMLFMLPLKRDDHLTIRNYRSTTSVTTISQIVGGSVLGANVEIVIRKIAAYPKKYDNTNTKYPEHSPYYIKTDCYEPKLCKKLKRKFKLFKKWLIQDPELMVRGSSTYGSFYSKNLQTVAVNEPVLYDISGNAQNVVFVPGTGNVQVKEAGLYSFTFMANTTQACQFTLFVNDVAIPSTTTGINKGANLLQMRQTIPLEENDIVSIRNFTSAAGTITISPGAGGILPGVNCILLLWKVAPTVANQKIIEPVPACLLEKNCMYKDFKYYLLNDDCLDITGSSTYFDVLASTMKELYLEDAAIYNNLGSAKNIFFKTNTGDVYVRDNGIYKLSFDIETKQPAQFTIYLNDVPLDSCISGTDSGAGQTSIRQLLKLCRGDKLTVRNHSSFFNPVITQINPGGQNKGITLVFAGYKIAPLHKHHHHHHKSDNCEKPQPPKVLALPPKNKDNKKN